MALSSSHRRRFTMLMGVLFAIFLILLQFHFFELRLLIDNSINLFMISVDKTFHASENRFMKIFTQILPVMGARLDVPFSWLPKLYVANDALWYIFGFAVLFFYFKDYEACFALVIGLLAAWKYYFFIIPCCLIISWPVQLMFFSMMRRHDFAPKVQSRAFLLMLIMIFFFAFGHPLIFFSFLFIYAYEVIGGTTKISIKKLIVPLGAFFSFLAFKWAKPEQYDMQQISAGGASLDGFWTSPFMSEYLKLIYYYPLFTLSLLLVVVLMIVWVKEKQYARAIVPTFALMLTIGVFFYYRVYDTHPYGDWFQKMMMPLAYFYAYVLADTIRRMEVSSMERLYKVAGLPILVLVVIEFGVIGYGGISSYFNDRLAEIEKLIKILPKEQHSKYYILNSDIEPGGIANYISPMEIVVISAIKSEREYTPNLLVVAPEEETQLTSFCTENFYINYIWMGHIKHLYDLNVYHNYLPGSYKRLTLMAPNPIVQ